MIALSGIPTLTTDRLRLVPPGPQHIAANAAFYANATRTRFNGGVKDENAAWHSLASDIGMWVLRGFGRFVMELQNGTAIGLVGPIQPADTNFQEPELAWRIWAHAYEGQGYAYEAAEATRDWFFTTHPGHSLVSHCDPDNTRSINLAERLGARFDGQDISARWGLTLRYRHPAPMNRAHMSPNFSYTDPAGGHHG